MSQRDNDSAMPNDVDRRSFMSSVGTGLTSMALSSLLGSEGRASNTLMAQKSAHRQSLDLKPRLPHHRPRAKSVIQLFMNGGPSQMDLFDPKPELDRRHGEPYFDKIAGEVENPQQAGALMRCPYKFAQHGESGMWVSDVMPYLSDCVDDITMIRSMHTVNITHEPAIFKILNGQMLTGYPSIGSWITYGLGSENQNLPAYVVLDDPKGLPVNGTQNWQSGFLSPLYQGTRFRSTGDPVLNLKREFKEPESVTSLQRNLLAQLDANHQKARPFQPRLAARIASYELAARMQVSATDVLDLSQETKETQDLYGIGKEPTDSYGRRCLMARRLVQRGVRFVQIYIDHQIWDNHTAIARDLRAASERTDQPVAGLLQDLKRNGLLDDTLVLWGGEMGRLPISQLGPGKSEAQAGRDHNKRAMCGWMAGGGVKAGYTHGTTDELGFAAVEDRVSVAEWHATLLHLLGLDHNRLTYPRNGLDEKLTGVEEVHVVKDLLA